MKRTKTVRMRKRIIALSAAAFCMITAASVKEAAAYFTTYVSAGGSHVVNLGSQTEIHENKVTNMTKHIFITNNSQTNDCFVRVKVFAGDLLKISFKDTSESGNLWTYSEEDGYWYYGPILPAGASTEILDAKIEVPENFDQDSFNVVVIQECTPVIYDEKTGNPSADWNIVYSAYQQETRGKGAD